MTAFCGTPPVYETEGMTTGEKSDGKYLQDLIEKSHETGMEIETVIGDTAYPEKDNIRYAKKNKLESVSKLNPVITDGTRPREKEFEFNKDADLFVCPAGHLATRKARTGKKNQGLNTMYPTKPCHLTHQRLEIYQFPTDGSRVFFIHLAPAARKTQVFSRTFPQDFSGTCH